MINRLSIIEALVSRRSSGTKVDGGNNLAWRTARNAATQSELREAIRILRLQAAQGRHVFDRLYQLRTRLRFLRRREAFAEQVAFRRASIGRRLPALVRVHSCQPTDVEDDFIEKLKLSCRLRIEQCRSQVAVDSEVQSNG